ncbi:hypothetical protein BSZ39_00300 [Bowdeniella nasicola]|uniref:Uncharacterized protein n=2 Tax=Bowdeniella nasicola TaxID=208480 RepID=A0A1Q5Q5S2_9ACTO|nr:hypothetical protein BSZ39_00300 [Bowdeniella nasicola]
MVSISKHPQEAADAWRAAVHMETYPTGQKKYIGDGWVSIRVNDQELVPTDAWFNTDEFWDAIDLLFQDFMDVGEAFDELTWLPLKLALRRTGQTAIFTVDSLSTEIEPISFLPSVIGGMDAFYRWNTEYNEAHYPVDMIEELHDAASRLPYQ